MHKARLEAFSDGVLAIIITIMVLELKVPHGHELSDFLNMLPVFVSYILSFIYVGIYWNNHHHLFQAAKSVNGAVMWANLHLLFWLSTVPFVTAWAGENHFAGVPVAFYGGSLLMAGVAYYILVQVLLKSHGPDSKLHKAIGADFKGKISLVLYAAAIGITVVAPLVSCAIYVAVAMIWLVPDQRIEKVMQD